MPPEAAVRLVDHNEGRGTIPQRRRSARTGELSPHPGYWHAGAQHPQGMPTHIPEVKTFEQRLPGMVGTLPRY